jgi:hypothetical protein
MWIEQDPPADVGLRRARQIGRWIDLGGRRGRDRVLGLQPLKLRRLSLGLTGSGEDGSSLPGEGVYSRCQTAGSSSRRRSTT